jgi:hypothetical protein
MPEITPSGTLSLYLLTSYTIQNNLIILGILYRCFKQICVMTKKKIICILEGCSVYSKEKN